MPEHAPYRNDDIVNPETRHEDSDVNVRALLWAVVIFIVFAALTHLVLYLQFHAYAKHFRRDESQPLTMMARPSDASVPPTPRLQPFPRKLHDGNVVRLGQYLNHSKPVLLNFMYYRCPMLCPMVMDGVTNALTELRFDIGKEFDVVTISIDPRDTPEQAAMKKTQYVNRYGRFGAANGWHFLTGPESATKRLTKIAGFEFAYDPKVDQFAHGAVLLAITPQGRVSRYLYGFEYK